MQATVEIILPVFGMILLGYAIGHTRLLSADGIKGLSNFVFYVAIPALLFRRMSTLTIPEGIDVAILPAYFGSAVLLFAVMAVAGRGAFRLRLDESAMMGMGSVFSNSVLLGIPMILLTFGEEGLLVLLFIISVHALILITLPTIVIELARGHRGRWPSIVWSAVRSLLRNPVILAMLLGLLYGTAGLGLVSPVERFIDMLGAAASPAALFALGASLTGFRIAGDIADSLTIVAVKLIALPILVWFSTTWVFGIDPRWAAVATLNAAMPVGANVFLLAQSYDVYVQRSASAVLISTGLAMITTAIVIALVGPR